MGRAGRGTGAERAEALAELCQLYWFPLYAFIRRRGKDEEQARDLTQAFFARLLEGDRLAVADPARGRFRAFLLTSLRSFLANHADHQGAQKRGGQHTILSMDFERAEWRYAEEPLDDETPERRLDRAWAVDLVDHCVQRLREEYSVRGRAPTFERLVEHLGGAEAASGYREAAVDLGVTVAAVKVTVHRMRARLKEILRAEIRETVDDPGTVDEEIRDLFAALLPPGTKRM